jgi:flagellar FliL protein
MRTILALPLLLSLAVLPIQAEEGAPAAGVQYVELKPAFVGTVGPGPKIQYMKIDVALRANDGTAVPRIETLESIATLEGKEALRSKALTKVREVLEEEEGKPLVDDLLFTNLVTQ